VRQRGFALVAVLLVLGLLGIIGAEFSYSMRLEAESMRAWRDNMRAAHLAEAGVEQALRELSGEFQLVNVPFDGVLTFYKQGTPMPVVPRLVRTRVRLGSDEFSYRITDEQARINVNNATHDQLDKLLQCLGVDKVNRDQIVDSILDWIDTNDEHRANGAESDDYYLKLPIPYRAHNSLIESVNELQQIKGVTSALFEGEQGRPGLRDLLTARGAGRLNVNTAGPVVFCAMGVSDAQISNIMQGRLETPITDLSGLGSAGGFFVNSTQTFRIEADGLIDGRPRASVTAVVQKRNNAIVMLEWSGVR
jgi:type II secretory pathway component PulK